MDLIRWGKARDDFPAVRLILGLALPPSDMLIFLCATVVDRTRKRGTMQRVIRVCIDVRVDAPDYSNYEFCVWEKIRTAAPREILSVQCGQQIHEDDFELVAQLVDDVVQSAVSRTIGIAERLPL